MNIELINTGSELMLGRVLNTHQQWLCRRLADLGYVVTRQVAVADTGVDIQQAVKESLSRADLVVATGGLGPTSDDITRDLIAQLLGKKLYQDEAVAKHIRNFFAVRKRPMPGGNLVQALVPEGATVLWNPNGTAPGLAMLTRALPKQWLILLPGPPRELRPMFDDAVVPLLRREFPPAAPFVCRTLRSTGMGESAVQEKIGARLKPLIATGLELGYCARVGQVDVRLAATGTDAAQLIRDGEAIVRAEIGAHIFGVEDEHIEEVVVRLLAGQKKTLALAESCTGGCIAHRITNVPGASAVLLAGLVTYANDAKQTLLGVRAETLAAHGAVSEAVAREMAEGARKRTGADVAVSVTGIAGPSGGSAEKPVGTAFIGFSSATESLAVKVFNPFDRETFKSATSQQALELLRRKIVV